MAEHIDNARLHTDLRYRFEYLSNFLNFTSDDIAMLNTFAPIVLPILPAIADAVYRKLFAFDVTKHYFLVRNDGCITLDSTSMELRRTGLSVFMERVLTQSDWNDTFLQYLSQIGQIHTDQAGLASINVDYIHINALLGYLQHLLIDAVHNVDAFDSTSRRGIVMALNKFFCIQNDFFAMHYLMGFNGKVDKASHCSCM
jgi:hypothetical protein